MHVAVFGADGQLGRALVERWIGAVGFRRADIDIDDSEAVARVDWALFDVVVNAAAYTAIDAAESEEGRVAANGFVLVHLSSKYVFEGRGDGEESARMRPSSCTGRSASR